MNQADLVIVTTEAFPIGMAATNRTISYAKEIAKHKRVTVLIPQPTENASKINNKNSVGEIDNIQYIYTNKSTIWPFEKNKLIKFGIILIGLINLVLMLIKIKPKTVIAYTSRDHVRKILLSLKKLMSFKLVSEEDEYPKILNKNKWPIIIKKNLDYYKKCDGMIIMTHELVSYYKSLEVKNIFQLPMTVDLKRFESTRCEPIFDFEYFIYIGGNGGFQRDGVINIVESFCIFHEKYPDIKLVIVGPTDNSNPIMQELLNTVNKHDLRDSIILTGAVSSSDIPSYLINACGIVMAPQKNYTSGGFPTKLGEFLASGRPVVVTSVSEIPMYLNDKNSFIVPPGNNFLFASKMEEIVSNKKHSVLIGEQGKITALNHFNAEKYAHTLIEFLEI